MTTARAPGRVNLIGEHVDYNGGRCLPMAIDASTQARIVLRDDNVVQITSRQEEGTWIGQVDRLGPGAVDGWTAYAAGVAWAMRERGVAVPGFELYVDGQVPIGAGLSSSAALGCSVALALDTALGLATDRSILIEDCIRAEREVAGAPTGGMDQTVSMLAKPGHALLIDCASGDTRPVPWQPPGLALLIVDTRASHALVDGAYAERRASCEEAARLLGVRWLAEVSDVDQLAALTDPLLLRRARHVVTEVARVDAAVEALTAGDYAALGGLFTASHVSLRDDFEVSCPELDAAVEACLGAGALGARMTGGGFGGSAIALLPQESVAAATDACATAFADRGWEPPRFLRAEAGPGARVGP